VKRLRALMATLRCNAGTTAVEFAMVAPAFIALIVGSVYASQMVYETSSMRFAVEAAARCAAINTTTCSSTSTTQSYAASHYYGPSPTPTFTASSATCGQNVSASATFALYTGLSTISVPLSASACYP
jgi:Flp pilus assembly protein TadG